MSDQTTKERPKTEVSANQSEVGTRFLEIVAGSLALLAIPTLGVPAAIVGAGLIAHGILSGSGETEKQKDGKQEQPQETTTKQPETEVQAKPQPDDTAEKAFNEQYKPLLPRRQQAVDAVPPTDAAGKAKQVFLGVDGELQKLVEAKQFDKATEALPGEISALDDFDTAVRKELEDELALLDGCDEAKSEAARLRGEVEKLGKPPASLLGAPGYPALAKEIIAARPAWQDVHLHNVEMEKLKVELKPIEKIPGQTDGASALKGEWGSYLDAKSKAPDPATGIVGHDQLAGQRDALGKAARALIAAFEAGKKTFESAYAPLNDRRQQALGVTPPTEWTKKAKQTFATADTTLQGHISSGEYDKALLALPQEVKALDEFDTAARKELENDLTLLDGWNEAKVESGKLRVELGKLGKPPASLLADPGYKALADKIKAETTGWREVRRHNTELAKLKIELKPIDKIPGKTDGASPLKAEWDAYKDAQAKLTGFDPATTTADHDKLAAKRDALAKTGRELCSAYESGKAGAVGNDYYQEATVNLYKLTVVLFRTALKVPPRTPEIVALQRQMQQLQGKLPTTPLMKDKYANLQATAEIARKLVPMRTQPVNPAAAAFQAKWAKAEKPIEAVVAGIDPSMAPLDAQKFKEEYDKLIAELGKKDACDYTVCETLLTWLNQKAEPVLKGLTDTFKTSLEDMKNLPAGNPTQKNAKAEKARTLIDGTNPAILARLSAKEHCDLMDGLRTTDIPAFDGTNKDDPKRVAMRKLYTAMSLDPTFMAQDDSTRTAMLEALKDKKQELKDAQQNWSSMTDKQKLDLMKMLADQQCASFKFPLPKDGFEPFNDPNSTNNGSYSPGDLAADPPQDKISVNTAQPVFHDFEAALDLVFHENGHKYQSTLVRAMRSPKGTPPWLTETNTDPPFTQARMFDLGNHGGTYVKGGEDYEIYKKQPEEDHAWTIGPRTAQMLIDMLNA